MPVRILPPQIVEMLLSRRHCLRHHFFGRQNDCRYRCCLDIARVAKKIHVDLGEVSRVVILLSPTVVYLLLAGGFRRLTLFVLELNSKASAIVLSCRSPPLLICLFPKKRQINLVLPTKLLVESAGPTSSSESAIFPARASRLMIKIARSRRPRQLDALCYADIFRGSS